MASLMQRIHLLDRTAYALLFVAVVKVGLFLYFSAQFKSVWPAEQRVFYPFISGNDTPSYFNPMEDFLSGEGYTSMCRMPGLAAVYVPLRWLMDHEAARTAFVLLQLLAGIFATLALARIAQKIFGQTAYYITLIVMSFSSFVSIWDHFGYSDSFSIYFLIFSAYFALRVNKRIGLDLPNILWSSVFLIWSIFIRPAHLVAVPAILLLIVTVRYPWRIHLRNLALFGALPVLLITAWTWRNYQRSGRFVPLQDDISTCYGNAYPVHYIHLRDLMLRTGGDYQRTTVGAEMYWFQNPAALDEDPPFSERHLAQGYTVDSLVELRTLYRCAEDRNANEETRAECARQLIAKSGRYKEAYRKDKPFNYYIGSKLRHIRLFTFPGRLDNLPFPARDQMNPLQFGLKSGYLILFHLINLLGLAGILFSLFSRSVSRILIALLPLTFIGVLAGILGFVEQRYFGPAYPFMLLMAAGVLQIIKNKWMNLRSVKQGNL